MKKEKQSEGRKVKKNALTVLKFGGSSVGSLESIQKVLDIADAASKKGPLMLVCSAMGGVTNELIKLGNSALAGEEFIAGLRAIEQRHQEVIRTLMPAIGQNKALVSNKLRINELEELLYGIRSLSELSPASLDRIVAQGELMSNELVAHLLQARGLNAVFTDARKLIQTNSQFGNATVLKDVSYANIRNWHASMNHLIPVVTGFIGSNERGQSTSLGRGGSDYTAALLGAALGAQEVQIWTDVDGFMTADPRRVKKAYSLEHLSYEEAMELCYFGAKVIYPPTMLPAIEAQIPIRVKNTFNASHPGTLVGPTSGVQVGPIKGIASIEQVCLINLQGSGLIGSKGTSAKLFGALAAEGVNAMLITQASSEHSISVAIGPEEVDRSCKAIESAFELELMRGKIEPPQVMRELSILAVVGENMRHTPGISGRLFQTLGRNGINVVAIAQGSSERNISVVIERKTLTKALRAIHDALFLSPLKTIHTYLVGTGNIGAELIAQLRDSAAALAERHHLQIRVMGISNSRQMLLANAESEGIDLNSWKENMEEAGEKSQIDTFIAKAGEHNLPNAVLVDNTSSEAVVKSYPTAFETGLNIVTCNKIGNSTSYTQYQEHAQVARRNSVEYYYETTVGAALPIIQSLKDLIRSGDKVLRIEAILSGTISYIFNHYQGDISFAEVVAQAQKLGYTEPDPRDDLNGMDFTRKMLILAREMGLPLEMKHVDIQGILTPACLAADSVEAFYEAMKADEDHFAKLKDTAASEGKRLRYIGVLEGESIRIAVEMVDASHPFYGLGGSDNIIAFTTERYQAGPLVVKGPGAGPQVTAAGVYADIMKISGT